jgi:NADH/F420H2 dehydrogenase subunit C
MSVNGYSNKIMSIIAKLTDLIPGLVISIERGIPILLVPKDSLVKLMLVLRYDTNYQFTQLVDMTAVDYIIREPRFDVVYMLLSVHYNVRCIVKTVVNEVDNVPSMMHLYSTANWMERETWDMFGITFEGHTDRRRILTDYGFEGHPLRKDFPRSGYTQVRYNYEDKRVVLEDLQLDQEYRAFDFHSGWKPMDQADMISG